MRSFIPLTIWGGFLLCAAANAVPVLGARYDGRLTIRVIEESSLQPLAARMELRNARGRAVRIRPENAIVRDGYFVFNGSVTLELKKGNYEFDVVAGPEFQTRSGHFSIEKHAEDSTVVTLKRRVNMQADGWWAADLDVCQPLEDMPLLMRASGTDYVTVSAESNVQGKCQELKVTDGPISDIASPLFGPWASVDLRRGGGVVFIAERQPLHTCGARVEGPSLAVLQSARAENNHAVAMQANSWDLPIWIAAGQIDAVQVLHRPLPTGYPRDSRFFPGALGEGRWSEAIYHHLLNCGLRIPPAAGSGSGANENPIGTNRVYAYCGQMLSRNAWWESLRAGKVVITNGPLLRTTVEGHPPGHVFALSGSTPREFQIALNLSFYERAPVDYLEILKDGSVVHQIPLRDLAERKGRLPLVVFESSGWFAVRAIAGNSDKYTFATTGPYYVERDNQPRVSRTSVLFFRNWLKRAAQRFTGNEAVLKDIEGSKAYWDGLLTTANAD